MMRALVPATDQTAFPCPHCGALTTQYWHSLHPRLRPKERPLPVTASLIPTDEAIRRMPNNSGQDQVKLLEWASKLRTGLLFIDEADNAVTCYGVVENLSISECYNCKRFALWVGDKLVDPPVMASVEPNPDMPDDIAANFNEARSIVNNSPRGAAALLRLCVQKLCIHLGEKGRKIDDDIASLVKKGLNVVVQQALDIVRVVGNASVHPGAMDLRDDRSTANSLFGLVNAIAEQMISHPKHVAELYQTLPQAKRDAIDKRDGRASGASLPSAPDPQP